VAAQALHSPRGCAGAAARSRPTAGLAHQRQIRRWRAVRAHSLEHTWPPVSTGAKQPRHPAISVATGAELGVGPSLDGVHRDGPSTRPARPRRPPTIASVAMAAGIGLGKHNGQGEVFATAFATKLGAIGSKGAVPAPPTPPLKAADFLTSCHWRV